MNIEKIYELVTERNNRINRLFDDLGENRALFETILTKIGLEINDETILALTKRFVSLREDDLRILLKKRYSDSEITEKQVLVYEYVKEFWLDNHLKLIEELKPYLTPFYYTLLKYIHNVGEVFSEWQLEWENTIVNGINKTLFEMFDGDEEKIFELLREKELLDKGPDGNIADRCYSVLVVENGEFKVKCYSEIFENSVKRAILYLEELSIELNKLYDDYKEEWINYIRKIIDALRCKNRDRLVDRWADVDRAWMDIKSPIQMGHPLEYYEDHYRKAVALELDIRVINPKRTSEVKDNIKDMYKKYFNGDKSIYNFSISKIDETQLYLGQPILFYGAEFNGLFSAQVVPNDEDVSKEKGKKIFAFADKILSDSRSRPKMEISYRVFGEEFMEKSYQLLDNEELWHKVYDISTVGHEFGHILWLDIDSEKVMNVSGAFKNVEEFKATMGGLMAFFEYEDENLKEYVLRDVIKRSVGLISWMEVGEVLPYYIEGLIHLYALFESGVLEFDGENLSIFEYRYEEFKKIATNNYLKLVYDFYLEKKDPRKFLSNFISKEDGVYLPKNNKIKEFVKWYYELYKEIGQKVYKK